MHQFRFIGTDEAVRLHAFALEIGFNEAHRHVRDIGLLESALSRPQQRFFYEDVDLPALAATLLWGLVQNHAFFDGNKRTAWLVTQAFLYRHGYELPANIHAARLVLNIALGRRSVDDAESWIRSNLVPVQRN